MSPLAQYIHSSRGPPPPRPPPAEPPPPGPDGDTVETFCIMAACIVIIGFRIFCRAKTVGFKGLGVDDHLMIGAIFPMVAEVVVSYITATRYHGYANNSMTDEGRKTLMKGTEEWMMRTHGSKTSLVGWVMYATFIWMIKGSMCAFYLRLTAGLEGYRVRVYIGFAAIIISYITIICVILFSCMPFEKHWQIYPDPGNFCQPAVSKLIIFVSIGLNVATDIYLLMIPLPMLWRARLSVLKKVGLMFLFSGGIIVLAFAVLRGTAILQSDNMGVKEGVRWAVRESLVAIATANLPVTWAWMKEKLRPSLGTLITTYSRGTRSTRNPQRSLKYGREPGSIKLDEVSSYQDPQWRGQASQLDPMSVVRSERTRHTFLNESDSSEDLFQGASLPPRGGIMRKVELEVLSERLSTK